jgi:DNA invertase Pin-like site-specific DNA recombinase
MNEPYLLRKQQRKGRRNKQQEGKEKGRTPHKRRKGPTAKKIVK